MGQHTICANILTRAVLPLAPALSIVLFAMPATLLRLAAQPTITPSVAALGPGQSIRLHSTAVTPFWRQTGVVTPVVGVASLAAAATPGPCALGVKDCTFTAGPLIPNGVYPVTTTISVWDASNWSLPSAIVTITLTATSASASCNCKDGAQGIQGPQGPPGQQGDQGTPGTPGRDAASNSGGVQPHLVEHVGNAKMLPDGTWTLDGVTINTSRNPQAVFLIVKDRVPQIDADYSIAFDPKDRPSPPTTWWNAHVILTSKIPWPTSSVVEMRWSTLQ